MNNFRISELAPALAPVFPYITNEIGISSSFSMFFTTQLYSRKETVFNRLVSMRSNVSKRHDCSREDISAYHANGVSLDGDPDI